MSQASAEALSIEMSAELVEGCLGDSDADRLFRKVWNGSLGAFSRREKAIVAPVTGHVAESLVELILQEEFGYNIVWHLTGPGTRGVDLIVLSPQADKVVAIEVKGTLRSGYRARMSGRALKQMTVEWLDKPDNPGMAEWGFASEDLYGGVTQVNFADMRMSVTLTRNFREWLPIKEREQLADLEWL